MPQTCLEFEIGPSRDLRPDAANPARVYDYLLDGKDHYRADREAAADLLAANPELRAAAWANRAFLGRAVDFLAREAGVDQFLDIGPGLPAANSTHTVAGRANPSARVVYVDNDPVVLAHARALLTGLPAGRIGYLQADVRDPASILTAPKLLDTLDLRRPVALLLTAVMHFIQDEDDPYGAVAALTAALPSGSYLAMTHATHDLAPARWRRTQDLYREHGMTAQTRTSPQFDRFFIGLDMVSPGRTSAIDWRPSAPRRNTDPTAADVSLYAAIGRKP